VLTNLHTDYRTLSHDEAHDLMLEMLE